MTYLMEGGVLSNMLVATLTHCSGQVNPQVSSSVREPEALSWLLFVVGAEP